MNSCTKPLPVLTRNISWPYAVQIWARIQVGINVSVGFPEDVYWKMCYPFLSLVWHSADNACFRCDLHFTLWNYISCRILFFKDCDTMIKIFGAVLQLSELWLHLLKGWIVRSWSYISFRKNVHNFHRDHMWLWKFPWDSTFPRVLLWLLRKGWGCTLILLKMSSLLFPFFPDLVPAIPISSYKPFLTTSPTLS